MNKLKKAVLTTAALSIAFYLGQTHAQVQVMDFDTPSLPAALFADFSDPHVEGDFEHTAISFSEGTNDPTNLTSHIHGNTSGGSRTSELEADAGGALFRRADGSDFSFESWDVVQLVTAITPAGGGGDSTVHVVGINDGVTVADVTLTSADAGSTIDFLALNSAFGNVDLVEYYFDPAGRGNNPINVAGLENLDLLVDNVTFNDTIPPVPEPETYAMLLVGLGLVGFAANRRRNYYY